jgi:hypothetical protein
MKKVFSFYFSKSFRVENVRETQIYIGVKMLCTKPIDCELYITTKM